MIQLIPYKREIYSHGERKTVHALKLNPVHPMDFDVLAKLIAERTTTEDSGQGGYLVVLSMPFSHHKQITCDG